MICQSYLFLTSSDQGLLFFRFQGFARHSWAGSEPTSSSCIHRCLTRRAGGGKKAPLLAVFRRNGCILAFQMFWEKSLDSTCSRSYGPWVVSRGNLLRIGLEASDALGGQGTPWWWWRHTAFTAGVELCGGGRRILNWTAGRRGQEAEQPSQFDSKATSGQGFSAMPPAANAPDLPLGMFVVFWWTGGTGVCLLCLLDIQRELGEKVIVNATEQFFRPKRFLI